MYNNLLLLEKFKNQKEGKSNSCVCKFSNVCFIISIFLQKVDLPLFSMLNCQTILLHSLSQIYILSFQSIEKRIAFLCQKQSGRKEKEIYFLVFLFGCFSFFVSFTQVSLSIRGRTSLSLSHGVFSLMDDILSTPSNDTIFFIIIFCYYFLMLSFFNLMFSPHFTL